MSLRVDTFVHVYLVASCSLSTQLLVCVQEKLSLEFILIVSTLFSLTLLPIQGTLVHQMLQFVFDLELLVSWLID